MSNKIIYILVTIILLMICLVGCKDGGEVYDDTSSTGNQSSVPIVIVDDEDEKELTQSEIDEITDNWENNTPTVSVEIGTDNKGENSSSNSSSDNNSDSITSEDQDNNSSNDSSDSSTSQESSDDSSTDNSSNNSSNTDSSDTGSEKDDDGYFDVAV